MVDKGAFKEFYLNSLIYTQRRIIVIDDLALTLYPSHHNLLTLQHTSVSFNEHLLCAGYSSQALEIAQFSQV